VTIPQSLALCALTRAAVVLLPGDRGRAVALLLCLSFWIFARIVDGAWFDWAEAPRKREDSDDDDFS
jgi:hypothetical protein